MIPWDHIERVGNTAATIGGVLFGVLRWGRQAINRALHEQVKPIEEWGKNHEVLDAQRHQQNIDRITAMEKNQAYQIDRLDKIANILIQR